MTKHVQRRGFTIIEVLIAMSMASVLAAIAVPKFFQAQKRARNSEAVTNLKSLHAAMSTQAVMPTSIHVPGFDAERGNSYSYHLDDYCSIYEDRSAADAVSHEGDTCIGADTFANPTFPSFFFPVQPMAASWDIEATANNMATSSGVFGTDTNWDYLAYAAGNLDKDLFDSADTWGIASADGLIGPMCPSSNPVDAPAGEPFQVNDDTRCN